MTHNKKDIVSFDVVFKELERRVEKLRILFDTKLSTITKYYVAILLSCDNVFNQHFAENALTLFTHIAYDIDALNYGYLPFEGQERSYKGFISKQCGSFDSEVIKANKRDMSMRLTICCLTYLSNDENATDSDIANQIDVLCRELLSFNVRLQTLGDGIASALKNKNKGRGGYKFIFSVKYYTGFIYSVECSADTNAKGDKIPRVSEGVKLLKTADDQGRDLFNEINSLMIAPHPGCPHDRILTEVDFTIAKELEFEKAEQLRYQRVCEERTILAQKKEDEKKRKRETTLKANEEAARREGASSESSSSSVAQKKSKKRSVLSKKASSSSKRSCKKAGNTKSVLLRSDDSESSDTDDGDLEEDGGITLDDYIGGVNDSENLLRAGRHKPAVTSNLDIQRDNGYDDLDNNIVRSLRGANKNKDARVAVLKDFILRGGQVQDPLSDNDKAWSDSDSRPKPAEKRKSQLDGLSFDDCQGATESSRLLKPNQIDLGTSSDDSDDADGVRAARNSPKRGVNGKAAVRRNKKKKSVKASTNKPKSRDESGSSDNEAAILRSSSSSDSDALKKKYKPKKKPAAPTAGAVVVVGEDEDIKPRKVRDVFGLTEQQVTQYGNMNLVPFQTTAAQHQSARHEMFEVDGRLMSEDEIKNLIFEDLDVLSKNLDTKFISFVRQHIMVDVFKDVHFLTNVIDFYRLKRCLHETQPGEHIICVWQVVLKNVASDLIEELKKSNEIILKQMDKNLLDLKELRKQTRLDNSLSINSVSETDRIEEDLEDLKLYKKQMKLNKTALEGIEKVMSRRIVSTSHSLGAKLACVWAKLNGFQHLLRNNMSRFEKKFILDPSTQFYSVLSDDLSRKWGDVATSPGGLFQGIDLAGSNNSTSVDAPAELFTSDRVVEMDVDQQCDASRDRERGVDKSVAPTRVSISCAQSDHHDNMHVASGSASPVARGMKTGVDASVLSIEDETARQMEEGEEMAENEESFQSPVLLLSSMQTAQDELSVNQGRLPGRPSKGTYTSALLTGSQSGSPNSSQQDSPVSHLNAGRVTVTSERLVTTSRYQTPLVITSSKRAKAAVMESNSSCKNTASYLSSVSSGSSTSSGSPNDICVSNTAVLFDQLKHMSQDARSVESMKRFIEVMNEKPSNVPMPATKAEEDKILRKAKAKKKKEEEKAAAAAAATRKTAAVLAAASSLGLDIEFSSADEDDNNEDAVGGRVVRQKTDSYAILQKLFLYVCKKHVEVKDFNLNLQFFGQRLVRSLSNSSLLKFLLLIIRNKELTPAHLVVYFMNEKGIFAEFKCLFGTAYHANDYNNILADGYCIPRSMFALHCNEQSGYMMDVATMSLADSVLFRSSDTRRNFHAFLNTTRESIGSHCADDRTKDKDKKKLKTLMTLFAAFPQLKQVPAAYWACLDWVAYAPFNCTAFSTNYPDCVPGYAQLHCSSAVRRDMSSANALAPYSLSDIYRVLTEPAAPNFCVLEGQHAFIVRNPAKEDAINSFKSILGLFLSACQQNVLVLVDKSGVDFQAVEDVLEKMIKDNAYTLSETEATLMGGVIKYTDDGGGNLGSAAAGGASGGFVAPPPDVIVLCEDGRVPAAITLENFRESRSDDGVVVDLCDSDAGDMDRVKARAARALLARSVQELAELQLQLETSERENSFLLRLIAKDPSLMHNPPLEITAATSST